MKDEKDLQIIQKVLNGEVSAFAELVDRYKDMVFTLIVRICGQREEAEELAQDTFVKIYRSLESFRGQSKVSTWIYRIARNTAISAIRRKKHEYSAIDEDFCENYSEDKITPDPGGFDAEEQKLLLEAGLKKLKTEERALITLFYMEENSIENISMITSLSTSNVKVKLHRARKKMLEEIQRIQKKVLIP